MGNRRIIRILIRSSVLALLALGLMAGTVTAQKRSSRARKTTKPAPTPDMRPQAGEVAEQIRLLSRFIFVYGKVVNGLEVAREQAARNQTSPAIETRNRQTRDGLVASIERLAAGISTLSADPVPADRCRPGRRQRGSRIGGAAAVRRGRSRTGIGRQSSDRDHPIDEAELTQPYRRIASSMADRSWAGLIWGLNPMKCLMTVPSRPMI
jgi:hypothetical protein